MEGTVDWGVWWARVYHAWLAHMLVDKVDALSCRPQRKPMREAHEVNISFVHVPRAAIGQGFFGCKHFSQTNQLLQQGGQRAIDWRIS